MKFAPLFNWRSYLRLLRYLLIAAVLAGALIGLLGSEFGLRIAAQIINRIALGQVSINGVTGSLFSTLNIAKIQLDTPTKTITLKQTTLDWSAKSSWQQQQLQLDHFTIKHLTIVLKKPDDEPLTLPANLALPIAINLKQARIDTLTVQKADTRITLQPVIFNLVYAQQHYQLQAQAKSQWGTAQLHARLADAAPFKLSSNMQLALHDGIHNYDVRTQLGGTLSQLSVTSHASADNARADIVAQLAPFQAQPLTLADIAISNLNPAVIADGLPLAMLDGQAHITPTSASTYRGDVQLTNRLAGSLDQNKLPVTQLATHFSGSVNDIRFDQLALNISKNASVSGTGKWHKQGLDLQLKAQRIDLHQLHASLRPTQLNGKLDAHADAQQQNLSAALTQSNYAIKFAAVYQQQLLTITTAQLNAGNGSLNFTGKLALTGNRPFSAAGQLKRFNPAQFGNYPIASINAEFNAAGQIQPQLNTRLQLNIAHSTYNQAALSGHADLRIAQQHIHNSTALLQLGKNKLALQGSYGAVNDQISWQLDAPNIANFGTGFSGKLAGHGTLRGTLSNPAGDAILQGEQLHASTFSLAKIDSRINIAAGTNGAISAQADILDMRMERQHIQQAHVAVLGTRQKHAITLTTKSPQLNLNSVLVGSWHNQQWDGRINQFSNGEPYPIRLVAPAALAISRDSTQLSNATFAVGAGTLKLDQLSYSKSAGITTQGSATHIALGDLQQRLYPSPHLHNTLIVGSKWQLQFNQQANGQFELWREQGDITVLGDQKTPLGLDRTLFTLQAQHNQITVKVDVHGTTLGNINLQASTTLAQNQNKLVWSTHAPVLAHAQLDIPTISWIAASLSDSINLDGALQAKIDLQGSIQAPRFNGTINGTKLTFIQAEQGIALQNGTLNAEFDQDILRIKQLNFHAGGKLNAQGSIKLKDGLADVQLHAQASQLKLVNRPDRQITLTGVADVTGQNQRMTVVADLNIDQVMLGLNDNSTPKLGDDVVIIGRTASKTADKAATTTTPAWQVDADIKVNLGKHTQIKGAGIDAQLAGTLKFIQRGANSPTAYGTITIPKGSYTAFGQNLAISRGILNFAGAINNPGLDILATRTYPSVTVGAKVTGTALRPVARLVSTPELPDSEKLSWLVLGHGSEKGTGGAATKLLQAAASHFLGQNNALSMQAKLTQLTGLDEIGFDDSGTPDGSMLSLGKRLSDQVYITYQQGLTGTKQLVKITYELSRRLSLRAQGGAESALDLFYTFRFD